jgi:integrase/recombinase XerD
MGTPINVRVTGPLASYSDGFKEDLARQGYRSTRHHLSLMAQMSQWLLCEGLCAGDLSTASIEKFTSWRRTSGYVTSLSTHGVSLVLEHLINTGVVTPLEPVAGGTITEQMMVRYTHYLINERGLSPLSIRCYVDVAHAFLPSLGGEIGFADITTAEVTKFVLAECQRGKVASAKAMTTRLRSLLRFMYLEGLTHTALYGAVPTVASWRQSSLPKALDASDVARLLKSCDRRKTVGRRDFAVLLILSRLGLRAGEVAGLQLGDIDWRRGDVLIRGKGNREDRLPLPSDVGEAVVAWLQRGRPRCDVQSVFTRVPAPQRSLSSGGVSCIVRRACDRAGLPPVGAHRLRHTAATQMLRAGSSLSEVGQVLRHQSLDVTSIYAKVDRRSLVAVVRSWPGAL